MNSSIHICRICEGFTLTRQNPSQQCVLWPVLKSRSTHLSCVRSERWIFIKFQNIQLVYITPLNFTNICISDKYSSLHFLRVSWFGPVSPLRILWISIQSTIRSELQNIKICYTNKIWGLIFYTDIQWPNILPDGRICPICVYSWVVLNIFVLKYSTYQILYLTNILPNRYLYE